MHKILLLLSFLLLAIPTTAQVNRKKAKAPAAPRQSVAELMNSYRFKEAADALSKQIQTGRRRGETVDSLELMLLKANMGQNMISATEDIAVIDSFVVDKDKILSVYRISSDEGRIDYARSLLTGLTLSAKAGAMPAFSPQLGDKVYYSDKAAGGQMRLFSRDRLDDKWGEAQALPGLEDFGEEQITPFVMSDGTTMYLASTGDESLGGYDIFMTRYGSGQGQFLKPENIGMPFNSPANDYMFVIDETNNLGWFASDRFQPEGKVCVYVFIPNESRKTLSLESESAMRNFVRLNSIRDTWAGETEQVKAALAKLKGGSKAEGKNKSGGDFVFVVNDAKTYTSLSDFQKPKARQLASSWAEARKMYASSLAALSADRDAWAAADKAGKEKLGPKILSQEKVVESMKANISKLEKMARAEELGK